MKLLLPPSLLLAYEKDLDRVLVVVAADVVPQVYTTTPWLFENRSSPNVSHFECTSSSFQAAPNRLPQSAAATKLRFLVSLSAATVVDARTHSQIVVMGWTFPAFHHGGCWCFYVAEF